MTFSGDPFRALGLPPGASAAEIKRAYRALAKRYHPDSAGESALPRFLAIQAAYDMLSAPGSRERTGRGAAPASSPSPPRARQRGPAGPTDGPAGPSGPTGPQSDSDRTRATRDAFRTRRTRPGPTSNAGPTGGPAWWAAGRTGSAGAGAGAAGSTGGPAGSGAAADADAGSAEPGSGTADGRRGRSHRTATMGSTSYDDAPREPEPEWNGATWYGDSSGTYWTVNPKEYADPRKHGPEYLARARRRAAGEAAEAAGSGPGSAPVPDERTEDPAAGAAVPDAENPGTRPSATNGRSSPRDPGAAATGPDPTVAGAGPGGQPHQPAAAPRPRSAARSAPPAGHAPRATHEAHAAHSTHARFRSERAAEWSTGSPGAARASWSGPTARVSFDRPATAERDDDVVIGPFDAALPQRVVLALIAWPPIGYAAGAAVGEATGCGRFAATCTDPAGLLGLLVQPLIVGLLLLLPFVARPAAVASVAVGLAALGGGAVLSALGGPRAQLAGVPSLLIALLVMAYAVGLIGALSGRLPLPGWLSRTD